MNKFGNLQANQTQFPFILPELPYDSGSMEPYMTSKTFSFHHGKHHQAYVTNLNKLIESHDLAKKDLEDIISETFHNEQQKGIFNNAAQIWNHTFFWHSMKPKGGGKPHGKLEAQINKDFGSYDKFKEEFKNAGVAQFGSGWVWLAFDGVKLSIVKTANADLLFTKNLGAIITSDVWEHAYYIDYQNRRVDYLTIFLDHLINWEFGEDNFNNFLNK
jgi:Fe-Mn family superoxide dismutase